VQEEMKKGEDVRPFLSCMYRLMQYSYGLRRPIEFSEEAKTEIRMWRAWL
jgi:hypothetical protein